MRAAIRGNCLWCKCCFNSFNWVNYSSFTSPVRRIEMAWQQWLPTCESFSHLSSSSQHKGTSCEKTGKVCLDNSSLFFPSSSLISSSSPSPPTSLSSPPLPFPPPYFLLLYLHNHPFFSSFSSFVFSSSQSTCGNFYLSRFQFIIVNGCLHWQRFAANRSPLGTLVHSPDFCEGYIVLCKKQKKKKKL